MSRLTPAHARDIELLEGIIVDKCKYNFMFGFRMFSAIKASGKGSNAASKMMWRMGLPLEAKTQQHARRQAVAELQQKMRAATAHAEKQEIPPDSSPAPPPSHGLPSATAAVSNASHADVIATHHNSFVPSKRQRDIIINSTTSTTSTTSSSSSSKTSHDDCSTLCGDEGEDCLSDLEMLTDRLTRLSADMVPMSGSRRQKHFFNSLRSINTLLRRRICLSAPTFSQQGLARALPCPLQPLQEECAGDRAVLPARQARPLRRMLNIVVSECCLLPSKEHCPFLVIIETADPDPAAASLAGPLTSPAPPPPPPQLQSSPPTPPASETWRTKLSRVRAASSLGQFPGWSLTPLVVKAGGDLRREELALQFVQLFRSVFALEGVGIELRPYGVLSTGEEGGLIEFLPGTVSIDRIKRAIGQNNKSRGGGDMLASNRSLLALQEHFCRRYGPPQSLAHSRALSHFARSLAGYSLLTFLLQVKDRHNGNILLDAAGRLIHIDFGFMLGRSPGLDLQLERAPFKLTAEHELLLGGEDSEHFLLFKELFAQGLRALQKHVDSVVALAEVFFAEEPSFSTRRSPSSGVGYTLRHRLMSLDSDDLVESLINSSRHSISTTLYDWLQEYTNDILA